jgi:hypothetical protein
MPAQQTLRSARSSRLVLCDAGSGAGCGNCEFRADAHDLGRHALDRERGELCQRGQVVLAQDLFADDQQRAGAVRHLRAVGGGDRTLGREHRLELGQRLHGRIGAHAFVGVDGAGLDVDLAGGQVRRARDDLDRRGLALGEPRLLRGDGAAVRLDQECVLRLARDLRLGRDLHGHWPAGGLRMPSISQPFSAFGLISATEDSQRQGDTGQTEL